MSDLIQPAQRDSGPDLTMTARQADDIAVKSYTYLRLSLKLPVGVRWDSVNGSPTQGGCGGSPVEWICGLNPIPAGGGRARLPFTLMTSDTVH